MSEHGETDLPVGALRDPEFLHSVRPLLERYVAWFRPEVRGFERLPEHGPFLVVGNHSGGQVPPDIPVLLTAWWRLQRLRACNSLDERRVVNGAPASRSEASDTTDRVCDRSEV
jgi:hypothetical protein